MNETWRRSGSSIHPSICPSSIHHVLLLWFWVKVAAGRAGQARAIFQVRRVLPWSFFTVSVKVTTVVCPGLILTRGTNHLNWWLLMWRPAEVLLLQEVWIPHPNSDLKELHFSYCPKLLSVGLGFLQWEDLVTKWPYFHSRLWTTHLAYVSLSIMLWSQRCLKVIKTEMSFCSMFVVAKEWGSFLLQDFRKPWIEAFFKPHCTTRRCSWWASDVLPYHVLHRQVMWFNTSRWDFDHIGSWLWSLQYADLHMSEAETPSVMPTDGETLIAVVCAACVGFTFRVCSSSLCTATTGTKPEAPDMVPFKRSW